MPNDNRIKKAAPAIDAASVVCFPFRHQTLNQTFNWERLCVFYLDSTGLVIPTMIRLPLLNIFAAKS